MGSITTAFATSAKSEFFSSAHCFQATVTPTGDVSSSSVTVSSVSSMSGVAVGMGIAGTGIPSGTIIATIVSSSSFTMSQAGSASNDGVTLTIGGDPLFMCLIQGPPSGTYSAANVNYTDVTGNSDEVSGAGYTATGTQLTNVSPTTSGTTAFVNFSPNPSWTSASFSTAGAMIYNSSARLGGTSGTNTTGAGRCLGVFSFGGTQTVSSGTLTILMPAPAASTAIFVLA